MAIELGGLILSYLPVGKERRKKGFGSYWIGRVDKADIEFPSDEKLKTLFTEGEMHVISRGSNHCLVLLPIGMKKTAQRKFLRAINNYRR